MIMAYIVMPNTVENQVQHLTQSIDELDPQQLVRIKHSCYERLGAITKCFEREDEVDVPRVDLPLRCNRVGEVVVVLTRADIIVVCALEHRTVRVIPI